MSSSQTEVSLTSSAKQQTELTAAWKTSAQSKAALRHIKNRLEAKAGTGVLLETVMDPKKASSRKVSYRAGRQLGDVGGLSKRRGRTYHSPEKSTSRSPLRNTTQESNVRRNNVEFREPLASYREATPPPLTPSQLEAYSLQSVPRLPYPASQSASDCILSHLVYQRDTADRKTDQDIDSTHSSALESTEVCCLNDHLALDSPKTVAPPHHVIVSPAGDEAGELRKPKAQLMQSTDSQTAVPAHWNTSASSSPGSASQRLENLRRRQPDDKLEKLKERIRRQREHLEEAAERDKLLGYLEQPIHGTVGSSSGGTATIPTTKIRKVAAAPPAPIYKGFNSSETKIKTPDGKIWKEEEFHNLSRELYRDLSHQLSERTRSKHLHQKDQRPMDRSKEERHPKPVRKVHKASATSNPDAKQGEKQAIGPSSWREGQKLVKMVLGPAQRLPEEDRPHPSERLRRTGPIHRSSSDPRSEPKQLSRPSISERQVGSSRERSNSNSIHPPAPSAEAQDKALPDAGMLSADIQGILDNLKMECRAAEEEEEREWQRSQGGHSTRRGRGGSWSRTRTSVSDLGSTAPGGGARSSRSASPLKRQPTLPATVEAGQKKRHYNADTVRQYIVRQQEERKRRQTEERRAQREEAERKNQRLQELYRKQRGGAKPAALPSQGPVAIVQKRLQETYTKLLLEEVQLGATQTTPIPSINELLRPVYQPSGESDKENKRLEPPQSPSSSDLSLSEQPPPSLSRNDLDTGVPFWLQPATNSSTLAPPGDHLLSELLRLENGGATGGHEHSQQPTTEISSMPRANMSRIQALKAKAASLSNRIESEARKLAGEGINYGSATTMDVDVFLAPQPSQITKDDRRWASAASPPVREMTMTAVTNTNDLAKRIQRILSNTGQSSYDGEVLPGVGDLHSFGRPKEKSGAQASVTRHLQGGRKLSNSLEKVERTGRGQVTAYEMDNDVEEGEMEGRQKTDIHDSSGGSISEGPLSGRSEGTLSGDDTSPPHPYSKRTSKMADRLGAVDYCAGQKRDEQPLSQFQREAENNSIITSPITRNSSKTVWEELNKGSPLSVINIFTKNLPSQVKVTEDQQERNSPLVHSFPSGASPGDSAAYEDDFVSSRSSGGSGQSKKRYNGHRQENVNAHFEELIRRSPYEKRMQDLNSPHSSLHSSIQSPHLSSSSSPLSKGSAGNRGAASDRSDATLVEEGRSPCSPRSEALSADSRKRYSEKTSARSQTRTSHSDGAPGGASGPSLQSLGVDSPGLGVSGSSAAPGSPPGAASPEVSLRSGSSLDAGLGLGAGASAHAKSRSNADAHPPTLSNRAETTGELQYAPGVLKQRMSAELSFLECIEESMRQLGDVERLRGVSMAQQESVSLAQILKAQQHRHDHDLYELKIKAEREALEETRQKAAKARAELQEKMTVTQQETLGALQEATVKMLSQQAEAVHYTVDAARHIREMTELTRSQVSRVAAAPTTSLFERQKIQNGSFTQPQQATTYTDSGGDSSSLSPPHASSERRERRRKDGDQENRRRETDEERSESVRREKEAGSSSVEEDPIAANNSLHSESIRSLVDEKDSTSVATEYSLKFDESMTEDEIEERSFRSLLPSEAHRRGTLEKKPRPQEESEEETANHDRTLISVSQNSSKHQDASMAFSGGQDSFSQFTMDMVRQYMKDEDVRLQHQSSLLCLRQKALKEKTRTELAWLEHQKRRLRDKGEDDKMPPIRKKQRGLLMKLQQEQAEIRRLQEANKAARKERLLLLKQQEEIERMRNSTLRLKERLKSTGGDAPPETPVSENTVSEAPSLNMRPGGRDAHSPSPPLSVSGSETSSIMQKLKKMRSQMDEKFLTKREQQLMQRRHHAEELLEWKQRLDQEEAEVRRMEKEALAVWDPQAPLDRARDASGHRRKDTVISPRPNHQSPEHRTDSKRVSSLGVGEGDYSATPESSIHTENSENHVPESRTTAPPASTPGSPGASVPSSPVQYSQDFTSASPSPRKPSPPARVILNTTTTTSQSDSSSSKNKMLLHSDSRTPGHAQTQARTKPTNTPTATQTEPMSDQSDIESRIKALKEELRKRKSMAYQLKKEQKKRQKERLKAQEASLLKQLESYDDFIQKTKTELNKEPDSTPTTEPQFKHHTSTSKKPEVQPPLPHSSETSNSLKIVSESKKSHPGSQLEHAGELTPPGQSRSTSLSEELPDDPPTVTPTPVYGSPDRPTSDLGTALSPEGLSRPSSKEAQYLRGKAWPQKAEPEDASAVSRSDIREELEVSWESEDPGSECLFKLDQEKRPSSQPKLSESNHVLTSKSEEYVHSGSPGHGDEIGVRDSFKAREPEMSSGDEFDIPDAVGFSPKKLSPIKDSAMQASPPSAHGYQDDFDSPVESSPRVTGHSSKTPSGSPCPEFEGSREGSHSRLTLHHSQDEEEEDIAEELSEPSVVTDESHRTGRLLDLHHGAGDSKHKPGDEINFTRSQTISPSQTPPSPNLDEMLGFKIGDRVLVSNVQPGTLRFKGPTKFANGFWAGVELDKSEGSNNGTYDGVVYFSCEDCHGIFAPPDKITRLPDKFDIYMDTTEDEDSFFDDMSDKDGNKRVTEDKKMQQGEGMSERGEMFHVEYRPGGEEPSNETHQSAQHQINQTSLKEKSHLSSYDDDLKPGHIVPNNKSGDIILEFEDTPNTLLILDLDKIVPATENQKEHNAFVENNYIITSEASVAVKDIESTEGKLKDRESLGAFADKLLDNFVRDAVKQLAQIKMVKEQKMRAANQVNEDLVSSVEQKDGLPFFLDAEKEELSSPELCNRPESPVLGASGQEELAKRLAELELSRELLDELGDEQDWFDEDFGLSSRREQQRLKQREAEEEEEKKFGGGGRSLSSASVGQGALASPGEDQQVKTPPRPELPLPLLPKLPEQPAMVVPHSATEVEKLVHTATQEIWERCKLEKEGTLTLAKVPVPRPSQEYLGQDANGQSQEAQSISSYRWGVYDLTWEILQEIYSEDPNIHQPQWVKPRRVNCSYFHRVKAPGDITKVQDFIAAEVLKLYGLKKDQNQKTDWQKMLKFGRKKRDRVDHILVQELHEEESQWVNYDEDELFVKMQLADSILDTLLKDTADVLTQIYDKKAKETASPESLMPGI